MITTERLFLRNWNVEDSQSFFEIKSDPRVMEYVPKLLSKEESDDFVEKTIELIEKNGFGLWVIEYKEAGELIGFTGLHRPTFDTHLTPCLEVGWRPGFER